MVRFPQFPFIFFEITKCASDWGWMVNGQTVGPKYYCTRKKLQEITGVKKMYSNKFKHG